MVIIANKISPNLNGIKPGEKPAVPVPNARDGKVSNTIWDYTKDCTVHKETGKSSVYTEAGICREGQDTKKDMGMAELPEDGGISPSAFINSCMTGEDIRDLSEEETPLEEYTSSQVERAVSRVKTQRTKKQDAVDREVAKEQERQDNLERRLQDKAPLTPENLSRLSHAVQLAQDIVDFSQTSMKIFIATGRAVITPESIHSAAAAADSGPKMAESAAEKEDFEGLKEQVSGILSDGGVEVTEEAVEVARFLYENDLPVTVENVKIYQSLEELRDMDSETILARIADNMMDGVAPEKADLTKMSLDEAAELVQTLLETDDEELQKTFASEVDFVRAKRQLEEIRLVMTAEAARAMASKGIRLDIENLENIVEELRIQERQLTESILEESGLPVTEENTNIMQGTLASARQVLAAPVEMLGTTRPLRAEQTLQDMAQTAVSMTEGKLQEAYEAVGTQVRPDLGDRISKAFQNVDSILQELNLEQTAANERAVRILAYNRMPLTEENILDMKAYDSKVTTLMENLKPPVVAQLIRRQENPLQMTIEELSEKVLEIQKENIPAEDISFRKYLWKMDRQHGLSKQERDSMIGIYRLLDKVQKSDGAVIGQVIKEGKQLSFSSLLSATRSRRKAGMDVSLDESFGGLEAAVEKGTSISDQIQAAYGSTLVAKLQKSLSPKVLREQKEEAMELSLETLLEKCVAEGETDAQMAPYYEQLAEEIRTAADDADGRLEAFLKSLDMPDTMANMAVARQMLGGRPGRYEKLWKKEESETVLEAFDNPDELEEVYDKIDEAHTQELAKEKESADITSDGIASLAKMAGSISFYRNIRKRQMYEIPLMTEQGVTTCHVTIQDGESKEKGAVEITLSSEQFGRIQAGFRVRGHHVKGFVTAERPEGVSICRGPLHEFEKDLEEMGFTMDSESLVQGSRKSLQTGNRADGARNHDLYRIAKAFIVCMANGKDVRDEN